MTVRENTRRRSRRRRGLVTRGCSGTPMRRAPRRHQRDAEFSRRSHARSPQLLSHHSHLPHHRALPVAHESAAGVDRRG